ncbi:MAG: MinD/ParA family protein [Methylococcales bacterium]
MYNHFHTQSFSINQSKPARVLAIASGKGGVGKTCIATNLSVALARNGHRTALLDGDTGLSNADIMLGLQPKQNLSDVIGGKCSIADIVVDGPEGLLLIPAASGLQAMAGLSIHQQASIIRGLSELDNQVDILIVDVPTGISSSAVNFALAAQEIVVVVCDEPASLADAYAFIKLLSLEYNVHQFQIISNMVTSLNSGSELYKRLVQATDFNLDVSLIHLGSIEYDLELKRAVQNQQMVVKLYPNAVSSQQLLQITDVIESWKHHYVPRGCLEFFVERLIRFNCMKAMPVLTNKAS